MSKIKLLTTGENGQPGNWKKKKKRNLQGSIISDASDSADKMYMITSQCVCVFLNLFSLGFCKNFPLFLKTNAEIHC